MKTTLLLMCLGLVASGCPLFRPREADCGAMRSYLESGDALLRPFDGVDVATLTPERRAEWARAVGSARAGIYTQSMVHGDVSGAGDRYRVALDALRTGVAGTADAAALRASKERVSTARRELDRVCPVTPSR